mmetsp:Transcript_7077/g.43608  ORF Transcript_7077/g.43608 Transcript_7077/m.43608 type:complete len:403 (+) Transcript_7077:1629-2837(+)
MSRIDIFLLAVPLDLRATFRRRGAGKRGSEGTVAGRMHLICTRRNATALDSTVEQSMGNSLRRQICTLVHPRAPLAVRPRHRSSKRLNFFGYEGAGYIAQLVSFGANDVVFPLQTIVQFPRHTGESPALVSPCSGNLFVGASLLVSWIESSTTSPADAVLFVHVWSGRSTSACLQKILSLGVLSIHLCDQWTRCTVGWVPHTRLRRSPRPPPLFVVRRAKLEVGRAPRTVRETGVAFSAVQDSRVDGRTHGVRGTRPTRHGRNAGGHAFRQRWTCRGSALGWRSSLRPEVRFRGVRQRRRGRKGLPPGWDGGAHLWHWKIHTRGHGSRHRWNLCHRRGGGQSAQNRPCRCPQATGRECPARALQVCRQNHGSEAGEELRVGGIRQSTSSRKCGGHGWAKSGG